MRSRRNFFFLLLCVIFNQNMASNNLFLKCKHILLFIKTWKRLKKLIYLRLDALSNSKESDPFLLYAAIPNEKSK